VNCQFLVSVGGGHLAFLPGSSADVGVAVGLLEAPDVGIEVDGTELVSVSGSKSGPIPPPVVDEWIDVVDDGIGVVPSAGTGAVSPGGMMMVLEPSCQITH